jgi:RHS repeat-associated protein
MNSFKIARLLVALVILTCGGLHSAQAQNISDGQIIPGSVSNTQTLSWTFDATSGNFGVLVGMTAPVPDNKFAPTFVLFNPDGTVLTSMAANINTYGGWSGSFTNLPQTGPYKITASNRIGFQNPTFVANFTINLATSWQIPASRSTGGGTMTPGKTYNPTLNSADINIWTITANAGDNLSITMTGGTGFPGNPRMNLYNPDGSSAIGVVGPSPLTLAYTVPAGVNNGVLNLFAFSSNPAAPAPYSISMTGSTALPVDAETDGKPCVVCVITSCNQCANKGGTGTGEPINIATGNMFYELNDYTTVGTNPLAFTRSYNSFSQQHNLFPTALGPNWRSNYDRYLRLVTSTMVTAERADGRVINFYLVGSTWTPDTDFDVKLTNSGATWTLTESDDTVEVYTAASGQGTLNSITLRNGYAQTLGYTAGQLTSVTDSYSRVLGFTYTSGMLTGVTTPDTLSLTYGYTTTAGQSLLTSVAYNTSPVTSQTYIYENTGLPFALTGITDENGHRFATWAYDGSGRATSSQLAGGADLTSVSYDDATGNRTVTGPLGVQETYKFTKLQGIPKVSEIDRAANPPVTAATRLFTYDSNGYLASATDWNTNSTTYVNNSHGLPTTINEAVGSPVARTTTIAYDPTFVHLPKTITTPDVTTVNNYDPANGNLLTKVLTDTTTQTIPYPTNGETRTWTFTYTSTGQLQTAQLPRTDVVAKTIFGYTAGTLTSITDSLSHVTTINTFQPGGRPLTITDPNSVLTTLAYDARLRLHTSALTTAGGILTTTWDHDAAGNLTKATLPDNSFLSYGYDNAHRLTSITNILGENENFTLDATGDITQTLWKTAAAVTKRQHNATFDALGRMLTDVGGVGQTTSFGHDSQGNTTSITDPLLNPSSQVFDALNRLKTFTDALTHNTGFTYDAHDRQLTVTDPNGNATSYVYDGFGDAIQQANPDSGTTVYHYDPDRNLISQTDAASVVTNLTYDALDRIKTRKYPADATLNIAFTYDQAGHGKGIGRLTSLTDAAGSLSRNYDERGNITKSTRTISATVYTTTYAYNKASLITSITYPKSAWVIAYTRDTAGQVTKATAKQPAHVAVNLATVVKHLPFGPLNSLTWGNGVTDARNFDLDYRMTKITDTAVSAIQNLTYGYDADDNVKTITDAVIPGNSQTLGYDVLNRLMSAAGGYGSLSYTYDNNDNRKTDGATTYSYTAGTNRLSAIGATSVTSTATGNINAIGADTMTYSKENKLATATVSGTASTYTYDAFSQRLKLQVGAGTPVVQQYDQDGNLLIEVAGSTEADYAYLDGMPVAAINPVAATISYIHPEHLGTPQLATDATKTTVWSANYQPFGATTPTGSITQNLRLPGQYADATAFNHNGFRDYNSLIGRYLETDPIGLLGGLNTYGYASQNPVQRIDQEGLADVCADTGGAVLCGKNSGERGATGGSSGQNTDNPYKGCKTDPSDPRFIICRDFQTGKKVRKPKPADFPPNRMEEAGQQCKTCTMAAEVVVAGGTSYIIYRCVRMLPSLLPPLWPTAPLNFIVP